MPDPRSADAHGFVGIGADLAPATLLDAYSHGLFPMPSNWRRIGWWSPDPRGVLELDALRVSKSLRVSANQYEVRVDTAFRQTVTACAELPRDGGWINTAFIDAYTLLHDLGWAHSIETYSDDGQLVGGLYGVRINRFFAGESMFSTKRDASKVALVALVDILRRAGVELLDVQWLTPHLASMGATEMCRDDYLTRLVAAVG